MRTVVFTLGLLFAQFLEMHWNLRVTEKAESTIAFVFILALILDFTEIILKGICVFNKKGE